MALLFFILNRIFRLQKRVRMRITDFNKVEPQFKQNSQVMFFSQSKYFMVRKVRDKNKSFLAKLHEAKKYHDAYYNALKFIENRNSKFKLF